jgi:hypothetical protein
MRIIFKTSIALLALTLITSCGGGSSESGSDSAAKTTPERMVADPTEYDPKRGEGKYDETNVILGALDAPMAARGEAISASKCLSCHKLSSERLVGPGWTGVTERRTGYWIMNFITNPDPMIDKDPEVQAQLELCLVRMPNQNLADTDARSVLEYMRKNDGVN